MNTSTSDTNGPRHKAGAKPDNDNPKANLSAPGQSLPVDGGEAHEGRTAKPRASGGGEVLKTRQELAKIIGLSTRTIDRITKARTIPHIRTGRLVRYRVDAVLAALAKNSTVEAVA